MPRCGSTGKFEGLDETEVEVDDSTISGTTLEVAVVVKRICNGCGSERKTASMTWDADLASEHKCDHDALVERAIDLRAPIGDHNPTQDMDADAEADWRNALEESDDAALIEAILKIEGKEDERFELEGDVEAEADSRTQTTDRHGKPIKNSRYMKTFIGANLTAHITCNACEDSFELSGLVDEQASNFEEVEC